MQEGSNPAGDVGWLKIDLFRIKAQVRSEKRSMCHKSGMMLWRFINKTGSSAFTKTKQGHILT